MGMKSKYIALAMMGMMMANYKTEYEPIEFIHKKEPKKIIPKGCKEFKFYDEYGNVFTCVALTIKSAKNKFNKWLKSNNNLTK